MGKDFLELGNGERQGDIHPINSAPSLTEKVIFSKGFSASISNFDIAKKFSSKFCADNIRMEQGLQSQVGKQHMAYL